MICYAIRQISTGYYLPLFSIGRLKGGTHVHPTGFKPPRLFMRLSDAKNCLSWWLAGKCTVEYSKGSDGREYESLKHTPVPDRDANDFVVIEIPIP